jgi:ABC-type uncharacterized transport system involved in gliding motility auxiliary subunit
MPDMKVKKRLHGALFWVVFIGLVGAAGFLSQRYRAQWDVTLNSRNTLTASTVTLLRQMPAPVTITAYATLRDPRLGELRKVIRDFVARYQRVKPDIRLEFVDPRENPAQARKANIQLNGEMVVNYQKRSEHVINLNEAAMALALLRLARRQDNLIFYLDGHGERKLDGPANFDLGDWGTRLVQQGFKISSLNLAIAQDVPANTNLLVIAGPQVEVAAGEVDKIGRYLKRGGNLLWLIDPEPLFGLQPLVEQLGLELSPGVVVDRGAQELKLSPLWAIAPPGGSHPATQNVNLNTVFPHARQIAINENSPWHAAPLIEVAQRGWLETDPLDAPVRFDKQRDTAGPITIGYALTRETENEEQRVVVIGGGSFLANSFIGNGGNLDLGLNLVNWLTQDESLINVHPRPSLDNNLTLTRTQAGALSITTLIALPALLLAIGAYTGWRRRRL